jgi:CO/xanthine dehydrogenase Mo-binding subunit
MSALPQVEIAADGTVLVRTGKVEIGQGLHTALAQIVADALAVPLASVRMLPVDTAQSPDQGVTSGSLSVQDAGCALRLACAELRDVPGPQAAVGQSAPRRDLPAKLSGVAAYIHDLSPPGLLHGRVLHPPAGARLLEVDAAPANAAPGVRLVLRSGDLLGVVAATSAQADHALELLRSTARWSDVGDFPAEDAAALQALPATTRIVFEQGEPQAAARSFSARYSKPWIAHASIAPSCALACWRAEGGTPHHPDLHVWSHSQGIFNLRRDLALAFGIDATSVRVTHAEGAGCYGHNGADDVAFDAAWLARELPGHTVRLLWSRADELSHAPQGPAIAVALQAGVDAAGRLVSWTHELWSPGHSRRPGRSATPALLGAWQVAPGYAAPASIDMPLATGGGAERNAVPGYAIAHQRVRCHSVVTRRRSSALRGLGAVANVFAAESFIDEIARALDADPLDFRCRHLQHDPRALAVLEAAAARAGWGMQPRASREDGVGRGVAYARYKGAGAWCAVIAEVQAGATLAVRRLVVAADIGLVVNPDGAASQLEGGAIQATSWALKESAAVAHAGWADYPILRFSEVPAVDVVLMPSAEASVGAGEASVGPTVAAIANALCDALGVRVRDLPLTPEHIVAAMDA